MVAVPLQFRQRVGPGPSGAAVANLCPPFRAMSDLLSSAAGILPCGRRQWRRIASNAHDQFLPGIKPWPTHGRPGMTIGIFIGLLGGLVLLTLGGELLVRGSVRVAERLGVSPLLIGLTLVGFGTSMPELMTSVQAALIGSPGIAVGNIVGSNIANILLILGASALIWPIQVPAKALRRDGMLVAATAALLAAVGLFWMLDRLVGAVFLAGLIGYIVYAFRTERTGTADHTAAFDKALALEGLHPVTHPEALRAGRTGRALLAPTALALAGLVLVMIGGRVLVDAAVGLARLYEISETVIGLTIVAVGTSMPELVTSIVAAVRRQAEVALGNVLGSNIYNTLGIGGTTALISPNMVPVEIAHFDAFVMLAASVLLLLFARSGWRIGRREGGLLLAGYGTYVWAVWPA
jgi:cation:H+ antiporter